jgi:hypothetical protein
MVGNVPVGDPYLYITGNTAKPVFMCLSIQLGAKFLLTSNNQETCQQQMIHQTPWNPKHITYDAQGKLMHELAQDHEEYWFENYGK